MSVKTYYLSKGDIQLSEHFRLSEFQCHDWTDKILLNPLLIETLEKLFRQLNAKAINITSGYRTPSHSIAVGGYATDQHTQGNAADITANKQDGSLFSSADICCALEDLKHQGGVGRINTTESVHVDVRGYKCWFDEVNGERLVDSWYSYLGIPRPSDSSTYIPEKGIDVSEHNVGVNFKQIKSAGYSFVFMRAGYGRYESQKDAEFETHYKSAREAGMNIGAYWYSHATNKEAAKQEAELFLKVIKGKTFELPLFMDVENRKQFDLGKSVLSDIIREFFRIVKKAGYSIGLYCSTYYLDNYIEEDIQTSYPLWVADYRDYLGYSGPGEVAILQYRRDGSVKGYDGDLDLNYMYIDLTKKDQPSGNKLTDKEQVYTVGLGDTWNKIAKRYGIKGTSLLLYNNYANANDTLADKEVTQKTVKIPAKWVAGDVDGDGKVTAADARKALRASAHLINLTPVEKMRADIDRDGKVSSADARNILKKAGGLL